MEGKLARKGLKVRQIEGFKQWIYRGIPGHTYNAIADLFMDTQFDLRKEYGATIEISKIDR